MHIGTLVSCALKGNIYKMVMMYTFLWGHIYYIENIQPFSILLRTFINYVVFPLNNNHQKCNQ